MASRSSIAFHRAAPASRQPRENRGAAGIFTFAMDNAMSVVTNFSWTIAAVVLSGFALQQDDPERLQRSFQRAHVFLTATTLSIHAILFALAP
jgi:hypothetical protein